MISPEQLRYTISDIAQTITLHTQWHSAVTLYTQWHHTNNYVTHSVTCTFSDMHTQWHHTNSYITHSVTSHKQLCYTLSDTHTQGHHTKSYVTHTMTYTLSNITQTVMLHTQWHHTNSSVTHSVTSHKQAREPAYQCSHRLNGAGKGPVTSLLAQTADRGQHLLCCYRSCRALMAVLNRGEVKSSLPRTPRTSKVDVYHVTHHLTHHLT